jgi:hydroxyacylglutathione hydrolase
MRITQVYTHSPLRNFSYLISSDDFAKTVCIDPYDYRSIEPTLSGRQLDLVLNTHEHHDHFAGNAEVQRETRCQIYSPAGTGSKIVNLTKELRGGDKIDFGDGSYLEVIDLPGHTPCHIGYVAYDRRGEAFGLFSGDTVFNAGVGNCRSGNVRDLFRTVKERISPLPDEVKLYPGHDYFLRNLSFTLNIVPSNVEASRLWSECRGQDPVSRITDLGTERKVNVFFRLDDDEVIHGVKRLLPETRLNSEEDVFMALRSLRDQW